MREENQFWPILAEFCDNLSAESSQTAKSSLIADLLEQLIDCKAFVYLDIFSQYSVDWWEESEAIPAHVTNLARDAIRKRSTVRAGYSVDDLPDNFTQTSGESNIYYFNAVATPLALQGGVFGVCVLSRDINAPFSSDEIIFFEFLVLYAAITLLATSQSNAPENLNNLLTVVRDVSALITQIDNLEELSRRITSLVQKTLGYYYVAIFTLSPDKKTLDFQNSAGPGLSEEYDSGGDKTNISNQSLSPSIDVQVGEGIIGTVAQSGREIIANNVFKNQFYRFEDALSETKSEVALPIILGGSVLGVLDIQSNRINAFQKADLIVLRALSDNIAVALENSRLFYSLQTRARQLKSIYDVGNAITSILNFDELLEEILDLIQERLGFSRVHFFTLNPSNNAIVYQKGRIDNIKSISSEEVNISVEDERDIVFWVARNKNPLVIEDFRDDKNFLPTAVVDDEVLSDMVVPLIFADEVLGVIEIQGETPGLFNDEDLYIMEVLADSIAVALRNSILYRSEQWRRQVADSLREIAGLLSADISLNQVLDSILVELISTLPSTIAAIWLLDDDFTAEERYPELVLTAIEISVRMQDEEPLDNHTRGGLRGLTVSDIIRYYDLDSAIKAWTQVVTNIDSPIIRTEEMIYDPLAAIYNFDPNYSSISVPIKIGDKPLGVLSLIHEKAGKYGHNSKLLSSTFANYAAVAIENTRLFETAHDQAWISTVLLQVAEATQAIDSLDDLLQTIVHILPDLVGTQSCAILLWDEYIDSFVPSIAYGFTPQQFEEFDNWYLSEADVPAFGRLREKKSPVFLDEASTSGEFGDSIFSSFDFSKGLYVLFPMITQSEVMGAILVDFREEDDLTGEISRWEEKISIIQGIANQTAIGVENIQLIQAQEEEAYVSIALLQVAQAVVSANNLEDVLAAIVRITPILVGIRRSVIFLWDDDQETFRASQAYGFSREEISDMQPFYSPGDFVFLDVVKENNVLVYYPLVSSLEPYQWAKIQKDELINAEKFSGNIRNASHPQDLLSSRFPLLMGFPLAVKGTVLGLMIVEEVDEISNVPSIRIREKRLEIITGITQQAAVAIQNDILQRDVFERERLEREMELARDIQSAFLPERVPEIKGWDIDVRWRPARQVGGDFFDIINLQNNKLGVVVADVADKGMPAALYMTLVRTLIRAAILDKDSPREVLLRVNNLLVPDSRQGMFVTLVYAVISLDTGKIVISNAGHNPPISYNRKDNSISEHKRNAMALGVFHDIDIEERELELSPGEYILFYTDGITEAFSSDEELFGLDRLKKVVLGPGIDTAASLLAQIDKSVIKFSEGASQSDDITLVAIYRQTR